jgi:hypothetical protein
LRAQLLFFPLTSDTPAAHLTAMADAMNYEYNATVGAGFLLQLVLCQRTRAEDRKCETPLPGGLVGGTICPTWEWKAIPDLFSGKAGYPGMNIQVVADLGYIGVAGIDLAPIRTPRVGELHPTQAEFNTQLSKIRAAVEHVNAHLKTWRMLSEEGGRYRCPIDKYASMLKAVIGLFFFSTYE